VTQKKKLKKNIQRGKYYCTKCKKITNCDFIKQVKKKRLSYVKFHSSIKNIT
jgi:hypothetical protein